MVRVRSFLLVSVRRFPVAAETDALQLPELLLRQGAGLPPFVETVLLPLDPDPDPQRGMADGYVADVPPLVHVLFQQRHLIVPSRVGRGLLRGVRFSVRFLFALLPRRRAVAFGARFVRLSPILPGLPFVPIRNGAAAEAHGPQFAVPFLGERARLPPLVQRTLLLLDGYPDSERRMVHGHERSHALFVLPQRRQLILPPSLAQGFHPAGGRR
mmetsp:Transcript_14980/g.32675  ORF Transcript_14980/g.32675 Transcript_14980/m.32675 type:complete len:213 (-) Transcript_14980:335-973(-)